MISVTSDIRFVGAEDDNLDLFENQYPLKGGISYNSFLINAEDIAVIDAVDRRRCAEWMALVEDALAGRKPAYLIVQHMEPDHSGSIDRFVAEYPEAKIVATSKAAQMLKSFFPEMDYDSRVMTVTDGDTLNLGRVTLRFVTAPMVHWPEVMMTVDETDGVLFSADAFGTFALSMDDGAWDDEARRYYCNIVGKYGTSVQSVMKKLMGYKFDVIAPLHGPVLKGNLPHYWKLYDKWSRYEPEVDGVLVAYASVYGGTADAARLFAGMLEDEGAGVAMPFDLCRHDVSYAVAQAFRFSRLALFSATYDADMMPAMHNFLHHIGSKNLRNRKVSLVENGSWAPVAAKKMACFLETMQGIEVIAPALTIRSRLTQADIPALRSLAKVLANA